MSPPPNCDFSVAGNDQYSTIAEKFKKFKSMPIYTQLQVPSYKKLLGQLGNADVVDLACGEGSYTRMIRTMTTGRVVGIDISPEMIGLAKWNGSENIEYMVGDCCQELKIDGGANFDLVSAVYLLNYSASKEMLLAFIKNVYNLLKPGGSFVGVTVNPFAKTREQFLKVAMYGFILDFPNEVLMDGDKMEAIFKGADFEANVNCYYWSPEMYDFAFKEAGFVNHEWVPFELMVGDAEVKEYWKSYLECPTGMCFRASKKM